MKNWQKNLAEFTSLCKPLLESCFLVGSLAYGGKFKESSDIDLVATVNDPESWEKLCKVLVPENRNFARKSVEDYLNGEAQSLILNITREDMPYQIDIMLPDFYEKAEKDMNKNRTIVYQRVSNTADYGDYILGHIDKRITVPKPHIEKESTVLISTPLCVVKDEFYFGVYHQKLFTGYVCLWGDDTDVRRFCILGAKKTLETGRAKTVAEVIRSSVRYDRMSDEHKKNLIDIYETKSGITSR